LLEKEAIDVSKSEEAKLDLSVKLKKKIDKIAMNFVDHARKFSGHCKLTHHLICVVVTKAIGVFLE